jgi:hypothetical protein
MGRDPGAQLLLVGEGPRRPQIEKPAPTSEFAIGPFFAGFAPDVPAC